MEGEKHTGVVHQGDNTDPMRLPKEKVHLEKRGEGIDAWKELLGGEANISWWQPVASWAEAGIPLPYFPHPAGYQTRPLDFQICCRQVFQLLGEGRLVCWEQQEEEGRKEQAHALIWPNCQRAFTRLPVAVIWENALAALLTGL